MSRQAESSLLNGAPRRARLGWVWVPAMLATVASLGLFGIVARIPNAVFYGMAAFILLAAWSAARASAHARWAENLRAGIGSRKAAHTCLAVSVATVAVCFGATSLFKFDSLRCWVYDLGVFDSLCWFALQGKLLRYFEGPYDHFSPVMLVCLPFYWLWQTPKTLLVIQSCVLTLAAVPLYLLGRHVWRDRASALALVSAYLLNPLLSRVALYDFHAAAFLPLLFFYTCWAFLSGRRRAFWILLVLCLCVKEDAAILVLALGIFTAGKRRWRTGLAIILLATAWGVGAAKVYYPLVMGQDYPHYHQYGPILAGGLSQAPFALLREALAALGRHWTYGVVVLVLLPVGFLPLRSPWAAVCLCGTPLLEQFLNTSDHHRLLTAHYGTSPMLGALVAVVIAYRGKRPPAAFLFACALGANFWMSDSPFHRLAHREAAAYDLGLHGRLLSVSLNREAYRIGRHERMLPQFARVVPKRFSVTAQHNLGCFFTRRERFARLGMEAEPDFAFFDQRRYAGPLGPDTRMFERLRQNPDYRMFFSQDGFRFFCRDENWRAVVAAAERVLQREPDNRLLRYIVGAIYANVARPAEARRHLESLLPIRDAEYVDVHWLLGDSAYAQGDLRRAMAAFQSGLKMKPDEAKAHYALGLIHGRMDDRDAARQELAEALRIDPSLSAARKALESFAVPEPKDGR